MNIFTVWQEDENAERGYRIWIDYHRIEKWRIYDIEIGDENAPSEGPGSHGPNQ